MVTPDNPAGSRSRGLSATAPSAPSSPAPPSVVPDPPSPTTTRRYAGVDGEGDQRAHPGRAGLLGAQPPGQVEAAGLRTLDVGRLAYDQQRRGQFVTERSRHGDGMEVAPEGGVHHVDEARATVRHGGEVELVSLGLPGPAARHRLGSLDRGEGAGELVGGEEDTHAPILPRPRCVVRSGRHGDQLLRRPDPADDARRRWRGRAAQLAGLPRGRPAQRPAGLARTGPRSADRAADWYARTEHLIGTDPGGCRVAHRDGTVVGFATSLVRELMWILASVRRRAGEQGTGIGRALLSASRGHGRGCLRAMLNASPDPRAVRLYRSIRLRPPPPDAAVGRGRPRSTSRSRTGTCATRGPADFDLLDSVDRRVRGAAHGPDHALMASRLRLLVTDRAAASGYAYVDEAGGAVVLAATHRKAARALLWEALAGSDPDVPVRIGHVTAANQWALDVAVEARLAIFTSGFLAVHHTRVPAPYLPHI